MLMARRYDVMRCCQCTVGSPTGTARHLSLLRTATALAVRGPAAHGPRAAAVVARLYSDRTDYSHTERTLTKGRRAAERAAYATLEISHEASEATIKAQFRKLALLYHPDVCSRCHAH